MGRCPGETEAAPPLPRQAPSPPSRKKETPRGGRGLGGGGTPEAPGRRPKRSAVVPETSFERLAISQTRKLSAITVSGQPEPSGLLRRDADHPLPAGRSRPWSG